MQHIIYFMQAQRANQCQAGNKALRTTVLRRGASWCLEPFGKPADLYANDERARLKKGSPFEIERRELLAMSCRTHGIRIVQGHTQFFDFTLFLVYLLLSHPHHVSSLSFRSHLASASCCLHPGGTAGLLSSLRDTMSTHLRSATADAAGESPSGSLSSFQMVTGGGVWVWVWLRLRPRPLGRCLVLSCPALVPALRTAGTRRPRRKRTSASRLWQRW